MKWHIRTNSRIKKKKYTFGRLGEIINKKYFNINRAKQKKGDRTRKVIGILGTHNGVGVTHTAILMGTYLSEVKNVDTAIFEMNHKPDFQYLEQEYKGNGFSNYESRNFSIYDVHYFKQVKYEELSLLFNQDFDYYILDFGAGTFELLHEFLRCDYKIVLGSLTEWKIHKLLEVYDYMKEIDMIHSIFFVSVFGQAYDGKYISGKLSIKPYLLGYEPDPFLISKKTIKLFDHIIWDK